MKKEYTYTAFYQDGTKYTVTGKSDKDARETAQYIYGATGFLRVERVRL